MSKSDNKRIAKNTIFLYIRMGISMIIALYTSRVILRTLGVVDLGIYNVVGGITSIFSWLSGALSNSTQRFLNFEIGNNAGKRVNVIFNQSFWLYAIFALFAVILIEVGGSWMIYNKLVIPSDRIDGALWTLHATSFTLLITLLGAVYDSVLIARENMKIYAYIGLIDVVLKLVIVYMLLLFPYDKLKVYALLLSCVFVTSKTITILYCHKKYVECRLRLLWDRLLVKEMGSFMGWNSLGTIVFILNNQGVDILLNMFFGPVVNAAKAISNQVRNVVLNFTSNLLTAARPQIVKKYASGAYDEFLNLAFNVSKYLFFISWILGITLIVRIDSILGYWLKNVPDYTAQFCTWILIFLMINVCADPINCAFQAIGKQSKYILYGSGVYLLAFPLSYIAFRIGTSPVVAFIILAVIRFLYLITITILLKQYISFHYTNYIKIVLFPISKVIVISVVLIYPLNQIIPNSFFGMICSCMVSLIISIGVILLFGLGNKERTILLKRFSKYLNYEHNK